MTSAILKIRSLSSYTGANMKFVKLNRMILWILYESYERRQDGTATSFRMY